MGRAAPLPMLAVAGAGAIGVLSGVAFFVGRVVAVAVAAAVVYVLCVLIVSTCLVLSFFCGL